MARNLETNEYVKSDDNGIVQNINALFKQNTDNAYQPFPLDDMQQAYWVGQNKALDLNISARYYFEADCTDFDLSTLNNAWRQLIQRHSMLRTVILPVGEQQVLRQTPDYLITIQNLRYLNEDNIKAQLKTIREQMC